MTEKTLDLAGLGRKHHQDRTLPGRCHGCIESWPCTASKLLAYIKQMRLVFVDDAPGALDITGADEVEVRISTSPTGTGDVLWVNSEIGCVLRICRIKHAVVVDERKKK